MFAARAFVMLLGMAGIAYYVHTVSSAMSPGYAAPRPDTANCREMRADYNNARMAESNGYSYSSGRVDHGASNAIADKMDAAHCSRADPHPDPNAYAAYSNASTSQVGKPSLRLP